MSEHDPPVGEGTSAAVYAVLLVEDDDAVVDATSMALQAFGYLVRSANDGGEALGHLVDGFTPDLIVADYRLPGQNGLQVVQRIRSLTEAATPAILITGDTSAGEILASGVANVRVLRKPMDVDHFMGLIDHWSRHETWPPCND